MAYGSNRAATTKRVEVGNFKIEKKNFKILIINEINFPKTFRSSTTLKRLSVFFNPLSGVPTRIRQGERKFPGTSAEIGNFMT